MSRLSPPLELLPPVSTLASPCRQPSEQSREAVTAHAHAQGAGLAGLAVNLDLAPAVDLDHHLRNPADRYSRIGIRAVGSDPELVRRVAGGYCDALAGEGVACTLEHFPGLGRVFEDLVYPILDALLQADRAGALDRAALDRSEARLECARRALVR